MVAMAIALEYLIMFSFLVLNMKAYYKGFHVYVCFRKHIFVFFTTVTLAIILLRIYVRDDITKTPVIQDFIRESSKGLSPDKFFDDLGKTFLEPLSPNERRFYEILGFLLNLNLQTVYQIFGFRKSLSVISGFSRINTFSRYEAFFEAFRNSLKNKR